ncbi:MAG: alpha-E domain-containing protein [Desulfobulbaceae bacterium]|nr:MAG: alpha-E domain-containing protein [Desulfobulbaceae bacterium]
MLSRVADSLYWMSRYLERAENIARFLDVNWHLTLDLAMMQQNHWSALVSVTGERKLFEQRYDDDTKDNVIRFLTIDPDYPNSIYCCLQSARENARAVRDLIPIEMWEMINVFFHQIEREAKKPGIVFENPYMFCEEVKKRNLTLSGLAQDTMDHDEAWLFFNLGKMLERADKTSRIIDVKYFVLLPHLQDVGTIIDVVQWAAMLKATSSFQAYRHRVGIINPTSVAEFMLMDHYFPRSVLYCLTEAQSFLHEISGTRIGYFGNDAEKMIGQLCAELSYQSIEDIFVLGLHEFTDHLQLQMNRVDEAVFKTFFAVSEPHQNDFIEE